MKTDKIKRRKHKKQLKCKKHKERSELKSCKKHQTKIKHISKRRDKKEDNDEGFNIPIPKELQADKSMAPMTKEEWDKRQSVVRKVYDESTGRHRLIKGDGEVLEEIVSCTRHKEINKQATKDDGEYFQQYTVRNKM